MRVEKELTAKSRSTASHSASRGENALPPVPTVFAGVLFLVALCLVVPALFNHLSVVLDAAETSSRRVVYVGTYEKVESIDGHHCSGYSIDLWKHNDVLFGLLHHHRGLCGDPPCGVLTDIQHSSESRSIRFQAETLEAKFHFSGSLKDDLLTGTLAKRWSGTDIDSKETVRLPRHPQVYLADKFDSLEKWHEFYDPIQRCRGVTTYMLNR